MIWGYHYFRKHPYGISVWISWRLPCSCFSPGLVQWERGALADSRTGESNESFRNDLHSQFASWHPMVRSEQWKKGPLVVWGIFRGWNPTQLCGDYFINHELWIPINQPVQWKVFCFVFAAQLGFSHQKSHDSNIATFTSPKTNIAIENRHCWIGDTSLNAWFSIVMLVFRILLASFIFPNCGRHVRDLSDLGNLRVPQVQMPPHWRDQFLVS